MVADTTDKPVFINQMPDYQEAVRQIIVLSKDDGRFRAVASELGLNDELAKVETSAAAIKAQEQGLLGREAELTRRANAMQTHANSKLNTAVLTGGVVAGGGSIATGLAAAKRWGRLKGAFAGIAAGLAAGAAVVAGSVAYLNRPTKEKTALVQDAVAFDMQREQLLEGQVKMGTEFVDKMATSMLEQQKTLVGQGEEMKLVSSAQEPVASAVPASASMTAKYAAAPAASHAEAAAQSATAATPQR